MVWCLDFETWPITPQLRTPPPCVAVVHGGLSFVQDPYCVLLSQTQYGQLWAITAASPQWPSVFALLAERDDLLVNHSTSFDLACAAVARPDLTRAFLGRTRAGRADCTEIRERLLAFALGTDHKGSRYSLKKVAAGYGLDVADKQSETALEYHRRWNQPISTWPSRLVQYLAFDGVAPLQIYDLQEKQATALGVGILADSVRQVDYHHTLQRSSARGIPGDVEAYQAYVTELASDRANNLRLLDGSLNAVDLHQALIEADLDNNKDDEDYTVDETRSEYLRQTARDVVQACESVAKGVKALVYANPKTKSGMSSRKKQFAPVVESIWRRLGIPGPETATSRRRVDGVEGPVKYSCDAVAAEASRDPAFLAFQRFAQGTSRLGKARELAVIETGSGTVHTSYTLASTGRTRSFDEALQNRPKRPGDRESLAAFPGSTFLVADVDGLELCSFAESCYQVVGFSRMAEALRDDLDPHLLFAIEMPQLRGTTYDEAVRLRAQGHPIVELCRQTGKIANFGWPGGMGVQAYIRNAWRVYRVRLTEADAKDHKRIWGRTWPEGPAYLKAIGRRVRGRGSKALFRSLFSGRVRLCGYSDGANGYFQGLGADATKDATVAIEHACHDPASPLFGWRLRLYVHDEWVLSGPEFWPDGSPVDLGVVSDELERIICRAVGSWLPNVRASTTPAAARRWSKKIRRVKLADGSLVSWEHRAAVDRWLAGEGVDHEKRSEIVIPTVLPITTPPSDQVAWILAMRNQADDLKNVADAAVFDAWLSRARVLQRLGQAPL